MDANTLVAGCVFGVSLFLYTRLKPKNGNLEMPEDIVRDDELVDFAARNIEFDADGWKEPFHSKIRFRKVSANLLIKYDNNGLVEETVYVNQTDHYLEKSVFRGYCEKRKVNETFFYDFIRSCIDLDTGEAVKDVEQHLFWKYELSSEKTRDLVFYKYADLLKAFYFMAENDGRLDDKSIDTVRDYLIRLTGDDRISNEQVDSLFADLITSGKDNLELSVARAGQHEEVDLEDFLKCCEALAGSKKPYWPLQSAALEILRERQ